MASSYKQTSKPQTAQPGSRRPGTGLGSGTDQHLLKRGRKFKDDDNVGGNTFVPSNTLLEPNNVIPSWEFGDEEKKEVSGTLRKVREKYDNIHKAVLAKDRELENLKKKLDQTKVEENYIEDTNMRKTNGLRTTGDGLENIKETHDFELMLQRTYKHMVERMHKDLIATQIKAQDLQESYKSKQGIAEDEANKNRKAKQQRLQAQHRLEELMRLIDQDHFQRQKRIASLSKSIKNKEEALTRRVARVSRQKQIADQAANENKDSNELRMNENFLAQKLWSAFLKTKMEKEMNRTFPIENAFQKIRAATGFSDVQDIVQKFLTREQTYSQLLMAVSENEEKIDRLRRENEGCTEKLHELSIQSSNEANTEKRQSGWGAFAPDLHELDISIQKNQKEYEKSTEINKKVQLVNDQVENWVARMITKIDQQFNESIGTYQDKTMAFKFEKVMQATCRQLDAVIMEEDDEERGFVTSKDFMNDFATEEFLNKNIRVRPASGMKDNDGGDTNKDGQNLASRHDVFGQQQDDEETYNQNEKMELDMLREDKKLAFSEYAVKKRELEEKERKKRMR